MLYKHSLLRIYRRILRLQLTALFHKCTILDGSGFRRAFSTKTAIFKICNEVLMHSVGGYYYSFFWCCTWHLCLSYCTIPSSSCLTGWYIGWMYLDLLQRGFLSCLSKRCIFVSSLKFMSSSTSLIYGVTYCLYCLYHLCSLFNTFSTL